MSNIREEILEKYRRIGKKKIVVAMSGGVDSSAVAALLHDSGHDVIGITLQLYNTDFEAKILVPAVLGRIYMMLRWQLQR